jgi:hypothetical protein
MLKEWINCRCSKGTWKARRTTETSVRKTERERSQQSECDRECPPSSASQELGYRLCALGDRVLGKLAGRNKSVRGLDLAGGDSALLRVRTKF